MHIATITSQGQVTIPAKLRKKYNLKKNSQVIFEELSPTTIRIKPLKPITSIVGILAHKKASLKGISIKQLIKEAGQEAGDKKYEKYLTQK